MGGGEGRGRTCSVPPPASLGFGHTTYGGMSSAEGSSSRSGAGPTGDTPGRVQSTSTSAAAAGPSNARPIAPIPTGRASGSSTWNPLRAKAPATPVVAGRGNAMVQNGGGSAGGARVVKPGQVNAAMAAKAAGRAGGAVNRPTINSIIVNSRQVRPSSPSPCPALTRRTMQKGNPIIAHIKNVPWELGDIVPDYQLGATTGLLFLRFVPSCLPLGLHSRAGLLVFDITSFTPSTFTGVSNRWAKATPSDS